MTAAPVTRRELAGFAAAGLLAYLVDLAVFTALLGPAGLPPLPAKALAFLAACAVAYAGNALGAYRRAASAAPPGPGERLRQAVVFTAVNAAGAAAQLACLAVSHYCLGLTSRRADLVAGAGVGMLLGTAVRFWGTRTLVFGNRVGNGNGVVGWTG
ncbi:GtrA family protein [Streptomyces abyssomicinicus]|uniref:GtrA family protein n=1 Tax=Streptomyces abyssomicinicus TaxID=574929 RepID=UPI001FE6E2CD|nr:GtrA family protein [Streptomyces abyssomicinicus]